MIGLAPDAVEYARFPRGRRERATDQGILSIDSRGPEPWRAAVSVLADALPKIAAHKPSCKIMLSDHFVRCQVLAWNENIRGTQEYEALARAQFRAVHGVAADGWDIRLARAQYGAPLLACAVDAALLGELDALAAGVGVRLSSVQPHFAVAFDRWRPKSKASIWWFALIEPGRLWLGRAVNGAWMSVSSRLLGRDPVGETLAALEQEMLIAPVVAGPQELVHAVATGLRRGEVHALRDAGVEIVGSITGRRFDLGCGAPAAV